VPTHYWRDRREDGPTYHIDYMFLPASWLGRVAQFSIGNFAEWCGTGFSDHMPLTLELSD
jgi:exodeoxyribonuclease-3